MGKWASERAEAVTQTAKEQYHAETANIRRQIKELETKLLEHHRKFHEGGEVHYGYVGDLTKISNELGDIVEGFRP